MEQQTWKGKSHQIKYQHLSYMVFPPTPQLNILSSTQHGTFWKSEVHSKTLMRTMKSEKV